MVIPKTDASEYNRLCAWPFQTQQLSELPAGIAGICNDCVTGTFSRGTASHSRCVPHTVVTCPAGQQSKEVRDPTTWTIHQHDGPNHLGLWYNVATRPSNGPNHLGLCALQGDSSTDTTCDDCEAGTFSLGGGAACGPHGSSECGPGFVVRFYSFFSNCKSIKADKSQRDCSTFQGPRAHETAALPARLASSRLAHHPAGAATRSAPPLARPANSNRQEPQPPTLHASIARAARSAVGETVILLPPPLP